MQRLHLPTLIGLGILAIAAAVVPYLFDVSAYVVQMFMQAVTYAVAVLGMVVVLGYTGQINLAQAAFFGFGAYGVALGTVAGELNFWISLALGVGTATLAGLALGMTTIRLGGHYLAMITISFQQIFDLVLVNWIEVTRGPDGIAGIPRPSLFGRELADDRAYLLFCAIALYALVFAVWWLPNTRLGRAMRSVRENELAAEVVGVHTLRIKVVAFSLSALLGAIGGGLYAGGFAYISPDNFNFARSIEFLTATLLGGVQSPFGGVIGTVLIVQMPEWLKHLPESLQVIKDVYLAVYGIGVILIMVFLPEGIWGLIKVWRAKFAKPADDRHVGHRAARLRRGRREGRPHAAARRAREALRRTQGRRRHSPRRAARHGARADRSERVRQDDVAQRRQRDLPADARPRDARRRGRLADASAPACVARARPDLPEHPALRVAVGARERDDRRAARQQSDPCRATGRSARGRCRRWPSWASPIART
jgi:ABC-type branched-subunit amino acid transport system permease subunit